MKHNNIGYCNTVDINISERLQQPAGSAWRVYLICVWAADGKYARRRAIFYASDVRTPYTHACVSRWFHVVFWAEFRLLRSRMDRKIYTFTSVSRYAHSLSMHVRGRPETALQSVPNKSIGVCCVLFIIIIFKSMSDQVSRWKIPN